MEMEEVLSHLLQIWMHQAPEIFKITNGVEDEEQEEPKKTKKARPRPATPTAQSTSGENDNLATNTTNPLSPSQMVTPMPALPAGTNENLQVEDMPMNGQDKGKDSQIPYAPSHDTNNNNNNNKSTLLVQSPQQSHAPLPMTIDEDDVADMTDLVASTSIANPQGSAEGSTSKKRSHPLSPPKEKRTSKRHEALPPPVPSDGDGNPVIDLGMSKRRAIKRRQL
ncbi:hypothetical protein JOM56_013103 [Amanita muscaria]